MKYRYRNRKTGETITTSNRVGGKNWVPVEEPQLPPFEETPEADTVIEETPEAENIQEDAPAVNPKPTRRGKK